MKTTCFGNLESDLKYKIAFMDKGRNNVDLF